MNVELVCEEDSIFRNMSIIDLWMDLEMVSYTLLT